MQDCQKNTQCYRLPPPFLCCAAFSKYIFFRQYILFLAIHQQFIFEPDMFPFGAERQDSEHQDYQDRDSKRKSKPKLARATSMRLSHVVDEEVQYLVYDPETGKNSLKSSKPFFKGDQFYRKVNNTHEKEKEGFIRKDKFIDHQYPITNEEVRDLDPSGGKVILKRLIHLYPKNYRFSFFPASNSAEVGEKDNNQIKGKPFLITNKKIQRFLGEVNLFSPSHYKSFFITQDFDKQGRYLLVVNYEGRFHTEVVDDYIPIYEATEEPVWTRDLQNPWLCILLKMWAKLKGGYKQLERSQPAQFLKTFSNSNWRYYNLSKQPGFLHRFVDSTEAKMVLKSKQDNEVIKQGLTPGQVSYEILDIARRKNHKSTKSSTKEELVALIRSTVPVSWDGQMCYGDNKLKGAEDLFTDRRGEPITLERTMVMTEKDVHNLFACAYVTSLRKHAVSDYKIIEVPENTDNALYFGFTLKKNGFIDFSFQQPIENKRQPTGSSRLEVEDERNKQLRKSKFVDDSTVERYHKCKYMLIRNMKGKDDSSDSDSKRDEFDEGKKTKFEEFRQKFETEFQPLHYYCVEPEYLKGYNQGEGHFISTDKGDYIIRFRPETSNKKLYYVLNFTSNQQIKIKELNPTPEESSEMLQHSLISLNDRLNYISLNKQVELDKIVFANQYEDIGYSFVAVCSKVSNNKIIKIEVKPEDVSKSGYTIKYPYSQQKQPFSILVKPGQNSGIAMEKTPNFGDYIWPPAGIHIMYK